MYAYDLFKDNQTLEKIQYSSNTSHDFILTGQGVYHVKVFCKCEESVTTQRTPAVFYYGGEGEDGSCPFYQIQEMEVTNHCNLHCANCGTPTAKCKKGFIEDSTVLATLSWVRKGQLLNYHRVGEPLLHKELVKYVKWGVEAGIKPLISTNGTLLSEEKLSKLYSAGMRHLLLSLHTEQSWHAFLMCCEYFEKHHIQVRNFKEFDPKCEDDVMYFQARSLNTPENKLIWEKNADIIEKYGCWLGKIPVHTWAGNVPGTRQRFSDHIVSERQKSVILFSIK